jgi:hypothetical protein
MDGQSAITSCKLGGGLIVLFLGSDSGLPKIFWNPNALIDQTYTTTKTTFWLLYE